MPQRCGWCRGGGVPLAPWRGGGAAGAAVEGCRWHRGGVEVRLVPRWRGAVGTVEGWRCGWRRGGGVEVRLAPRWRAPVGATNTLIDGGVSHPSTFPPLHAASSRTPPRHEAHKKRKVASGLPPATSHGVFQGFYNDCGCPHAA